MFQIVGFRLIQNAAVRGYWPDIGEACRGPGHWGSLHQVWLRRCGAPLVKK